MSANATGYGDKSYWDQRYQSQDENYDWYLSYPDFKDLILRTLNVRGGPNEIDSADDISDAGKRHRYQLKTLVVGCGNSDLSEQMHNDGFIDMVSIDYSEVVVERMRSKLSEKKLKFEVADVRDMSQFATGTFDVIVDKGTLDAILCGEDSTKNGNQMIAECRRVLKPGGHMFVITYGQPNSRLNYLDKPKLKWTSTSTDVLAGKRYLYTCSASLAELD